jgi:hypothetical protein
VWFTTDGVGSAFALAPGAARRDALPLRFYTPGRPGTYRFRYAIYADAGVRAARPEAERVPPALTVAP